VALPKDAVREIIPDPVALYQAFRGDPRRVRVTILDKPQPVIDLGSVLRQTRHILMVVNTRDKAQHIYQEAVMHGTSEGYYHLSARMCPEHRRVAIAEIRKRLQQGLACRVVSTKLIEAGVDVDFPDVWREEAGMDSYAQAAGRCKREWGQGQGRLVVFRGEKPPPEGELRQAANAGNQTLHVFPDDPLCPEAVTHYFEHYYGVQHGRHDLDEHRIVKRLRAAALDEIPFRKIDRDFRLIAKPGYTVIVPYGDEGQQLIAELRACPDGVVDVSLLKQIQRYTVQLYPKDFAQIRQWTDDLFGDGQYVIADPGLYDDAVGLNRNSCR
jgi:hypothetical protein